MMSDMDAVLKRVVSVRSHPVKSNFSAKTQTELERVFGDLSITGTAQDEEFVIMRKPPPATEGDSTAVKQYNTFNDAMTTLDGVIPFGVVSIARQTSVILDIQDFLSQYGVDFYPTEKSQFGEAGQIRILAGTVPLQVMNDINRVSNALYEGLDAIFPNSSLMLSEEAWIEEPLAQDVSLHLMIPKDSNEKNHSAMEKLYTQEEQTLAEDFWGTVVHGFYRIVKGFPTDAVGKIAIGRIGTNKDSGDFSHGMLAQARFYALKSGAGGVTSVVDVRASVNRFALVSSNQKF